MQAARHQKVSGSFRAIKTKQEALNMKNAEEIFQITEQIIVAGTLLCAKGQSSFSRLLPLKWCSDDTELNLFIIVLFK